MPNTRRNGRYGRTNGRPRAPRRPRLRVTCARVALRVGGFTSSLPDDRVSRSLGRLSEAVAERLNQGAQRLAGDQLGDHGVGPDGLVRIRDQVPAGPDLAGGRLERGSRIRCEVRVAGQPGQPRLGERRVGRVTGPGGLAGRVEDRRGPDDEVRGALQVAGVLRDDPGTAADLTGRDRRLVFPLQRRGGRDLPSRDVQRLVEQGLREPTRPGHHEDLVFRATVLGGEVRSEHAQRGNRAVLDQWIKHAGHPGAVRVRRVDPELVALQLLEWALVAPQVDPVAERVPDVPDDVAGVLGGDLLTEVRPLLPGLRNRVAELVHQLLVEPEHHLRQVVLYAVLRAVDRALGG